MAPEHWQPIPGAPGYEISNHGRVRSVDNRELRDGRAAGGQILKQRPSNRGRPQVNVRVGGKPWTINVPRMVLLAHAGDPPPGRPFTRHHPNDDPWDNHWPENLSWCDQPTNEQDKINRAKRLGYVEARHAPSQQPASDTRSPVQDRKPVGISHQRLSRIVTKISRWWG